MVNKNFTKRDLSNKIYQKLGFSKNFSSILIDNIIESIISELIKSNKIKFTSFGTFIVSNKKARVGRNPKTKIETEISARKVIKFRPSLIMKEKLNTK